MNLVEVQPARLAQPAPGLKRRYFRASDRDLFVWQGSDGRVVAFQFSQGAEILSWSLERGMVTGVVDDGEVGRAEVHKQAPLILPDEAPDAARYERLKRGLEASVVGLDVAAALRAAWRG